MSLRVLVLGDIVGQSGCRALYAGLKSLVKKTDASVVVANAENASGGFGLTCEIADQLFSIGIAVLTSGNHIWQQREILTYMVDNTSVLRPANYPKNPPGSGSCIVDVRGSLLGVINLQGRVRLSPLDCPFTVGSSVVRDLRRTTKSIIVDFHAEDTEEKEALGWYLDGEVSAVVGTHTHVQTADERILKKGTAYITDIGMTGPLNSTIGFSPEIARDRVITQMPLKMQVSDEPGVIRGVLVDIDDTTGRAVSIDRVVHDPGM